SSGANSNGGAFIFQKTSGDGAITTSSNTAILFQNIGLNQIANNIPLFRTVAAVNRCGVEFDHCYLSATAYCISVERIGSNPVFIKVRDCTIDGSAQGSSPYGSILVRGQVKAFIERNLFLAQNRYDVRVETNNVGVMD